MTIKDIIIEANSVSSSNSNSGNNIKDPKTDSLGITQGQAKYSEQVSGQDVKYDSKYGMYVQYNPKYGVYHN